MVRHIDQEPVQPRPEAGGSIEGSLDGSIEGSLDGSIEGWLEDLEPRIRVGAADREAISLELRAHLNERVRDLMLSGSPAPIAERQALSELGDPDDLARRFRHAHRYATRKRIMNLSFIALGAGTLSLGIMAWPGDQQSVPMNVFEPTVSAELEEPLATRVSVSFDESTLEEAVGFLSASLGRSIHANWAELEYVGVDRKDPQITLEVESVPMRRVMELVRESVDGGEELRWSLGDDLIELTTVEVVDRRDRVFVSYDVEEVLENLAMYTDYDTAIEQLVNLIHEMVAPEAWQANGGQAAQLNLVGPKLFVKAPPRIHREVAWILADLTLVEEDEEDQAGQAGGDDVFATFEPGDMVTVQVFEFHAPGEWFSLERRIRADGTFRIPGVAPIPAAGLSQEAFEAGVGKALSEVLQHPIYLVLLPGESAGPVAAPSLAGQLTRPSEPGR